MCVAGEVCWCLQTLLSSAHVDDHDGHLTSVHGLRKLRVSVQMLLSFPLHLCQLTTGGPESIDGLLGFPLHYVAHTKKYRHQIQTQIPRAIFVSPDFLTRLARVSYRKTDKALL